MTPFLPEIPSDNLYKFSTFSGLLLIIFFTVYLTMKYEQFSTESAKLNLELRKLNFQTKEDDNRIAKFDEEVKKAWKNVEKSKKFRDEIIFKIENLSKNASYRDQQNFLMKFYPSLADNKQAILADPTI